MIVATLKLRNTSFWKKSNSMFAIVAVKMWKDEANEKSGDTREHIPSPLLGTSSSFGFVLNDRSFSNRQIFKVLDFNKDHGGCARTMNVASERGHGI